MADLRTIVNGVTSSQDAAAIINGNDAELAARAAAAQSRADAAIPATQKGAAGGVGTLNANGNLVNRQEGLVLANYRVSPGTGSSSRFATSGDLATFKYAGNDSTQVYGQFRTPRPNNSGSMIALDFAGQKLGSSGGNVGLSCSVMLYVLAAINTVNCFVNHRGDWRPTVLAGINTAGELCIVFDVNNGNSGAGFCLISLMDERVGHVGAINGFEWMANWSAGALTDLSSFSSAPIGLPDTGPLATQGGMLTGALQLPLGGINTAALGIGAANTGLYSGSAGGDVTTVVGGSARMRVAATETRVVGPVGWASSVGSSPDASISRSAVGALSVTAPAGTAFSGPVSPRSYTKATVPAASAFPGGYIDVSDAAGGACLARSNGSAWILLTPGGPI